MDIQEIGFGDFCTIEQKRYVGPNEFYSYKVVGRKKSNVWSDVPVDARNRKETPHDYMDDVVTVVCNNLDDRTVYQFRVSDLASVRKAQAVPEGFVVVPVQCPDPDFADSLFDELSKKAIGEFGDDLLIHFSDIDEEKIWALMVEAAKAQAVPEGFEIGRQEFAHMLNIEPETLDDRIREGRYQKPHKDGHTPKDVIDRLKGI